MSHYLTLILVLLGIGAAIAVFEWRAGDMHAMHGTDKPGAQQPASRAP